MKLTKAQEQALRDTCYFMFGERKGQPRKLCVLCFDPAYVYPREHYLRLEELGLVEINRLAGHFSWSVVPTDEGKRLAGWNDLT